MSNSTYTIWSVDLKSGRPVQPIVQYKQAPAAAKFLHNHFGCGVAHELVQGAKYHGATTYQFTAYAGTRLQYEELVTVQNTPEVKQ